MKKPLKITIATISAFLALVLIAYAGLAIYLVGGQSKFYKASNKEFEIPLSDNFVPQGFHYDDINNLYIISGYNSKGQASPIFLLNADNGEVVKKINLLKSNGSDFTGSGNSATLLFFYNM